MTNLEELMQAPDKSVLLAMLQDMNPVDIATEMSDMDKGNMVVLFKMMPKDLAARVFTYLDTAEHQSIVEAITQEDVHNLVNTMSMDDRIDLLQELPSNMVRAILAKAAPETRKTINAFLKYPENSAGSLMTVEFICLFETMTCADALAHIRTAGINKETIYTCYVTDDKRHLTGIATLRAILMSEGRELIRDIMQTNIVVAHTWDDQEEVANDFKKYGLIAMPVLDQENRIVGIITFDDINEVIEEEHAEDIETMAALKPSEEEYLKSSVWTLARNRILWLLLLMISATFTGLIIRHYEIMLERMVFLAAFVPMLMDTGGNAGAQISTLIVRGLGNGSIEPIDWGRVLWKELRVGLICAGTLAAVDFLRILCFKQATWRVNLVVNMTLFATVMFAKLLGCSLPLLAKRFTRFDPALMAGPLLTTTVDALTLFIYFTIASILLANIPMA